MFLSCIYLSLTQDNNLINYSIGHLSLSPVLGTEQEWDACKWMTGWLSLKLPWSHNFLPQLPRSGLCLGSSFPVFILSGFFRSLQCWFLEQTPWTWVWASSGSWWRTGTPGMLQSMGSQKCQTLLSYWTELNWS